MMDADRSTSVDFWLSDVRRRILARLLVDESPAADDLATLASELVQHGGGLNFTMFKRGLELAGSAGSGRASTLVEAAGRIIRLEAPAASGAAQRRLSELHVLLLRTVRQAVTDDADPKLRTIELLLRAEDLIQARGSMQAGDIAFEWSELAYEMCVAFESRPAIADPTPARLAEAAARRTGNEATLVEAIMSQQRWPARGTRRVVRRLLSTMLRPPQSSPGAIG